MPLWVSPRSLEEITAISRRTALTVTGVTFTGLGDDWLEGTLTPDERTQNPDGTLCDGALAILAESLGSIAATMSVDNDRNVCLGQIMHMQYTEPAVHGPFFGRAMPLSITAQSHLWEIRVRDATGACVCVAQLTLAVIDRPVASFPQTGER